MRDPKDLIHVTHARRQLGSDRQRPARVNWSGIGSVSPEEAIAFAEALLEAAREAKAENDTLKAFGQLDTGYFD